MIGTPKRAMQLDQLRHCLESPPRLHDAFSGLGLARRRARPGATSGIWPTPSAWKRSASCAIRSAGCCRAVADPDMALNNLERFLANAGGAAQLPALLESRGRTLETRPAALQHQPVLQRSA